MSPISSSPPVAPIAPSTQASPRNDAARIAVAAELQALVTEAVDTVTNDPEGTTALDLVKLQSSTAALDQTLDAMSAARKREKDIGQDIISKM